MQEQAKDEASRLRVSALAVALAARGGVVDQDAHNQLKNRAAALPENSYLRGAIAEFIHDAYVMRFDRDQLREVAERMMHACEVDRVGDEVMRYD